MNHNPNGPKVLSKKRYALARCMRYVQLLLLIVILFLPTISFTTESKELEIKASSKVSTFQFLVGDTETDVRIKGGSSNFFEKSRVSVDVPKQIFFDSDELYLGFRVAVIIFCLVICFFDTPFNGITLINNSSFLSSQIMLQKMKLNDRQRQKLTQVFYKLPKFLNHLEKFLFATIFITHVTFLVAAFVITIAEGIDLGWNFNFVYPIIVYFILIALVNNIIVHIVCSKDINIALSPDARIECYTEPITLTSDVQLIMSLFRDSNIGRNPTTLTEESTIEILQKYKSLLDAGIITEQEYKAKKAELLNQTKDKR